MIQYQEKYLLFVRRLDIPPHMVLDLVHIQREYVVNRPLQLCLKKKKTMHFTLMQLDRTCFLSFDNAIYRSIDGLKNIHDISYLLETPTYFFFAQLGDLKWGNSKLCEYISLYVYGDLKWGSSNISLYHH